MADPEHWLTIEEFRHPYKGQWLTRCACGWSTVSVTEDMAEYAGHEHIRRAKAAR